MFIRNSKLGFTQERILMTNGSSITICVFLKNAEGVIKKTFRYYLKVYRVTTDNLFLGRQFYLDCLGQLPGPIHHEIEILAIKPDNKIRPIIFHSHKSVDGKSFICYPPTISNFVKLREVLKTWCLGTTLSIISDFDFQEIFTGGMSHEDFWKILDKTYGITC